ncbi:MAG: glycosyltransferase family 39 protein, partial [Chloroflexi bacterium]|nr:glycosyltransferase family 39 protein [Chloroflexota bacterium]
MTLTTESPATASSAPRAMPRLLALSRRAARRLRPPERLVAWFRRHPDLLLGTLLALVALAARLIVQLGAPTFFFEDSPGYLDPAVSLFRGDGFQLRLKRPPGYPLLLVALLERGGGLSAITLFQHGLGVTSVLLTYWLGRRWYGRSVGVGAGLLVALSSQQLTYEHAVLTEPLFTVLLLCWLHLGASVLGRPTRQTAAVLGAVLALLVLVRPVGQVLAPIALLSVWLSAARRRARLVCVGLVIACAAVLVLPVAARNLATYGRLSVGGAPGESLLARTIQHARTPFRFDGSDLPRDPDPVRARARAIIQAGAARHAPSGQVRDQVRTELGLGEEQTDRLLQQLALEAIARDPSRFLAETPSLLLELFSQDERSTGTVYAGVSGWDRSPAYLVLPRQPLLDSAISRSTVEWTLNLYRPTRLKLLLPVLALLGAILSLRWGRREVALAVLCAAGSVVLLATSQVVLDGAVARYRAPLEPLIAVLGLGGLWQAGCLLLRPWPARLRARLAALGQPAIIPCVMGITAAAALAVRLWQLSQFDPSSFGNEYDEGIRMGQLLLMSDGYRPFRDIYASQGPLLLDYYYPFYALFGATVAAARLGALLASGVSLVALALIAREVGSRGAAFAALLLAATSPLHLEHSRLALAELPSITPTLLAVYLLFRFNREARPRDLHLSAALFALGVLLKPMAVVAVPPVLLLLLPRLNAQRSRVLLEFGVTSGIVVLASLVTIGPSSLVDQFVTYRVQAAGLGAMGQAWSIGGNARLALRAFQLDLPWLLVGLFGLPFLWRRSRHTALVLLTWALAAVLMLVYYSPLSEKHALYLLPPTILLAAPARASTVGSLAARGLPNRLLTRAAAALALVWLFFGTPWVASTDRSIVTQRSPTLGSDGNMAETLRIIAAVATPDDFIVTDLSWLSWLSQRPLPPRLADVSDTRIRSHSLTDDEIISQTRLHHPAVVVFWALRMQRLSGFGHWLSSDYALVRMYDRNRAVYVRRDLLALMPRMTWWQPAAGAGATFGDRILLESTRLHTSQAERSLVLDLGWRAAQPLTEPYTVRLNLWPKSGGGSVWSRDDRFLPPWYDAPWPAGAGVAQRRNLDIASLPPGQYVL